jgi:hypothetical protein
MAQHVWGDLLPGQRRTAAGSGLGVDSEAVLERVAAERTAAGGGEQRVVGFSRAFARPGVEDGDGRLCQRCDPLFAAFGAHRRMRLIIRMSYVFG